MRELLFIAFIVACPLMMIFMMRGGHGHGSGRSDHAGGHGRDDEPGKTSTDDLRRKRVELDRLIERREQFEPEQSETELRPTSQGRR